MSFILKLINIVTGFTGFLFIRKSDLADVLIYGDRCKTYALECAKEADYWKDEYFNLVDNVYDGTLERRGSITDHDNKDTVSNVIKLDDYR